MPVNNRNRRAFAAPKFQLDDLPQRNLQPMAAVSRDSYGNTSYAVQGSNNSTTPSCSSSHSGSTAGSCSEQGLSGSAQSQLCGSQGSCSTNNQQPLLGQQTSSHTATCILPNLYLGGQGDATSPSLLRKLKIRRILNVAGECAPLMVQAHSSDSDSSSSGDEQGQQQLSTIQTKHIEIKDHSDENISDHFEASLRYINDGIRNGEAILVHCRFGVSRSATIVIAYLMRYGSSGSLSPCPMSYENSFDYVKARRPQVSPNLGFVLALHQLDREQGFPSASTQFNSNNAHHQQQQQQDSNTDVLAY